MAPRNSTLGIGNISVVSAPVHLETRGTKVISAPGYPGG